MSTARKVAYNTIVQTGGRIVVSLLAIFTLRLSTNYLGATAYGYLVTVTAFITLFSTLTDWGLSTIAAKRGGKGCAVCQSYCWAQPRYAICP